MTSPEDPPPAEAPGEPAATDDPAPSDGRAAADPAAAAPPASEQPAPPAAPPATTPSAAGAGGGRSGEVFETVRQLRELRKDLDTVRRSVANQASGAASIAANVSDAMSLLSELLPRVDTMDTRLAEIAASIDATADDDGADAADTAATPDAPPVTPAIGWDDMDHDTARAAWEALARFVGDVLHARYRLTRLQIPDCWPLHPRLIRELAWLRSSYLDAGAMEPDLPPAAAPWHTRALPPFLANMLDAVDPRECRPGIHRLTEEEVKAHLAASNKAQHEGQPVPALTTETGPDRPRLVPDAFPGRGATPAPRPGDSPSPPTVRALPDLITGSCEPRRWLGYYREASAADLARRPPTAPPAPAPTAEAPATGDAPPAPAPDPAAATASAPDTAASGESAGDGRPERFGLDSSSDDLADGGPGAPGGPGGLGGLDGPAGPL